MNINTQNIDLDKLLLKDSYDRTKWYIDELQLQTPEMKEKIIREIKDISETVS